MPYTQAGSIKAAKATPAVLSKFLGVNGLAQLGQKCLGPTDCCHVIVHCMHAWLTPRTVTAFAAYIVRL